ncbi:transposable element Tcb1 transposase [Trichonephila clavipes]|nr:transposable element Tcb1 transposase [Trichonephila clavipes]
MMFSLSLSLSDKSGFKLQSDSRQTFIWRAPCTHYQQENNIEQHLAGAGLLIWGGILSSKSDLHFQIGSMTGQTYWNVILEQHLRLYRCAVCAEFVLTYDNAHPHTETS